MFKEHWATENLGFEIYVSFYLHLRPDDIKELPPDLALPGPALTTVPRLYFSKYSDPSLSALLRIVF